MHLLLRKFNRNATDALRKYRGKYPNQTRPNYSSFLSADRQLREMGIFHQCDRMLAIHVLYIMYKWNSNSSRLLKATLP
jgi:hypothetical protein